MSENQRKYCENVSPVYLNKFESIDKTILKLPGKEKGKKGIK